MDKPDKYRKRSLTDFLQYHRGDMTGKERNAFEKDLQKDPFAEEAAEGFSLVTDKEAMGDISSIRKKLDKRTRKRSVTIPYRIAAVLAILVALSVIFYNRNNVQELTLSKNEPEKAKSPPEVALSEPVVDKTEKTSSGSETITGNKSVSKQTTQSVVIAESKRLAVVTEEKKGTEVTDRIEEAANEQVVPKDYKVQDKDLVSASVKTDNMAQYAEAEKKMDASNVAGAAAPMDAKSRSVIESTIPQPVTGIDSFNIYIAKTILNPHPENVREELVILTFIVQADSSITNLKIIESPGPEYSNEAKRLLKEGPRWKPATINGNPVGEQYSLKILFK